MDVYFNKNILGKEWLVFCFNDTRLGTDLSLFSVVMNVKSAS